jgi:hypothetical protein
MGALSRESQREPTAEADVEKVVVADQLQCVDCTGDELALPLSSARGINQRPSTPPGLRSWEAM